MSEQSNDRDRDIPNDACSIGEHHAVRRVLLPDLDGELVAATRVVEDVLAMVAAWADEDPDEEVPAELDGRAADALAKLRRTIDRTPPTTLYAPDGDYEHEPLRLVELDETAVVTFGAAVAVLTAGVHARRYNVVREMVTEIVDERNGPSPAAFVELAARFYRLCDLVWDNDQRLVAKRIEHANLEPIVLTDREETAYRHLRDRFVAIWHNHDPLARWQY